MGAGALAAAGARWAGWLGIRLGRWVKEKPPAGEAEGWCCPGGSGAGLAGQAALGGGEVTAQAPSGEHGLAAPGAFEGCAIGQPLQGGAV